MANEADKVLGSLDQLPQVRTLPVLLEEKVKIAIDQMIKTTPGWSNMMKDIFLPILLELAKTSASIGKDYLVKKINKTLEESK